ncbi:hypothetical protein [Psychromicrobium sp. YIM B11713]|uniref:hypothetical protein n=1 Tax=Psychromicrobium sp. YIM B11713 TaxID=3145233 RepID=UPI00374E2C46
MELFIAFVGFVGGWLLVAGPVFQAATELREHEAAGKRFMPTQPMPDAPKRVSAWWWFLPPVKIILERRRGAEYRKFYFGLLSADDARLMVSYINKATGWITVGAGAFLIAVKETFELTEELHTPGWVFWVIVVVPPLLIISFTVSRVQRSEAISKGTLEV